MVQIDNVTYAYVHSLPAINSTSAIIPEGIQLLLGPNGAGKSTLLKLMSSMLIPMRGEIRIDDVSLSKRLPSLLQNIFYLDEGQIMPFDTIEKMVKYHSVFYPTFSMDRLQSNLSAFGLSGKEKLSDLSLGFRQKANISYALALGVKLLLLDEPTNGMDITSKKLFNHVLASNLQPEQTILVATHSVHPMHNLFDGVTILNLGKIILSLPIEQLLSSIAFVTSPTLPPNAIYHEYDINGYHSIIPNEEGEESNLDFELLYSCMVSDKANSLLNLLNTPIESLWPTI